MLMVEQWFQTIRSMQHVLSHSPVAELSSPAVTCCVLLWTLPFWYCYIGSSWYQGSPPVTGLTLCVDVCQFMAVGKLSSSCSNLSTIWGKPGLWSGVAAQHSRMRAARGGWSVSGQHWPQTTLHHPDGCLQQTDCRARESTTLAPLPRCSLSFTLDSPGWRHPAPLTLALSRHLSSVHDASTRTSKPHRHGCHSPSWAQGRRTPCRPVCWAVGC